MMSNRHAKQINMLFYIDFTREMTILHAPEIGRQGFPGRFGGDPTATTPRPPRGIKSRVFLSNEISMLINFFRGPAPWGRFFSSDRLA